jgi:hypothetical protein
VDRGAFDALVRGMGSQRSRRGALKGLAAGLFGLGVGRETSAQIGSEALVCREFCDTDKECNAGYRCGRASGQCFAVPSTRKRCNFNGDCPSRFEVCLNFRCQNTVDCIECRRNGDCPGTDGRCREGRCRVDTRRRCEEDRDCPRNQRCTRRGRCVDDR